MKKKSLSYSLFILTAILIAGLDSSMNASAILNAGTSSCDDHGTASFQLSYYGSRVDFEDARLIVLERASNQTYNISGAWNLDSIVFSSNDTEQAFPRFTSDKNFTAKGVYAVTFQVAEEKAVFTIICPGIACRQNRDCADTQFCNPNEVCESLSCGDCRYPTNHACMDKCDDNNICTQDTCNAGACENQYITNCCLTDKNCNDGLICTKETCMNYRCNYELVSCQKKDECSVPTCKEFIGCTSDVNQTCVKEKNKIYSFFKYSIFGKILKLIHLM